MAIGKGPYRKPDLLMPNEPILGPAPILVKRVFDFVRQIRDTGVTIFWSNRTRTALEIAYRGYVLENGRIVLEGTGQELLSNQGLRKAYL